MPKDSFQLLSLNITSMAAMQGTNRVITINDIMVCIGSMGILLSPAAPKSLLMIPIIKAVATSFGSLSHVSVMGANRFCTPTNIPVISIKVIIKEPKINSGVASFKNIQDFV